MHHRMQKIMRRSFFARAIVLQNSGGVVVQKASVYSEGVTDGRFSLSGDLSGAPAAALIATTPRFANRTSNAASGTRAGLFSSRKRFALSGALTRGGTSLSVSNGNHLKTAHCCGQEVIFRQNSSLRQVDNLASQHICFVPIKCHSGIIVQVSARPTHRACRRYLNVPACNAGLYASNTPSCKANPRN